MKSYNANTVVGETLTVRYTVSRVVFYLALELNVAISSSNVMTPNFIHIDLDSLLRVNKQLELCGGGGEGGLIIGIVWNAAYA